MIDVQALAAALAPALVVAFENDPELRAKVRALLAPTVTPPRPEIIFAKVADYASTRGYSRRFVFARIREGLPTAGAGRGLRIDVAAADEWLRRRAAKPSIEELARANARRAARRIADEVIEPVARPRAGA